MEEKVLAYVRGKNLARLDSIEANIPEALKKLKHWVPYVVKRVVGKDKLVKQPAFVNGCISKSNDSETWYSFEKALELARANVYCAGLMFATRGSGYSCIDLDKCLNKDGELSAIAKILLEVLPNNFCEKSVSGNGLHLFVKDNICENGKYKSNGKWNESLNMNEIEILENNNFVSLTGDTLPCFGRIIKRTELNALPESVKIELQKELGEIANLKKDNIFSTQTQKSTQSQSPAVKDFKRDFRNESDNKVLERMFASKNGAELKRLYEHGCNSGDKSRYDLKLCSALAYFTGSDKSRIRSLFKSSALYRPKEKSENYLERTIDKAINSLCKNR